MWLFCQNFEVSTSFFGGKFPFMVTYVIQLDQSNESILSQSQIALLIQDFNGQEHVLASFVIIAVHSLKDPAIRSCQEVCLNFTWSVTKGKEGPEPSWISHGDSNSHAVGVIASQHRVYVPPTKQNYYEGSIIRYSLIFFSYFETIIWYMIVV